MVRNRFWPALFLAVLLVLGGLGCRQMPAERQTARTSPALRGSKTESRAVRYSPSYDAEIESILDKARRGRWEEAREEAEVLLARAPDDGMVQRLHSWVVQQQQALREKALEDKIREVNAANSVFNPTIPGLLTEQKDRGLPASKDVRDTIEKIESSRLIPETYGSVRREKGPMFDLEAARGPMARLLDKEVTIHLDNVTLENLIIQLSQSTGINIVADKSLPVLKQTLTVNLEKVRLSEFLKYVSRNYEVQFQVGPELIWVTDAKDPKRLMEETRFYRLRTGFVRPARLGSEEAIRTETRAPNNVVTVTETQRFRKFVNDEAPEMPSLEQAITNFFSGTWYIDYERNLIVARGTPEQLEVLEKLIEEFDKPIQQVLIEARFVTISKPAFLQLGALWETGRAAQGVRVPQDFTGLANLQSFPSVNNVPAVGIGLQEVFTNILGRRALSATLSALEQSGESQTLSAPRLTVLNNRPATIADGKVQYYYEEYQVRQTVQQYYTASSWVPSGRPTKVTAGAELNVLASIAGDGKHIILALNPRVNTDVQLVPFATLADYDPQNRQVLNSFTLKLPEYRTQELATRVVVRSGETVVMGGVLERERITMVEAVPVLGNIPVIGAAFRRRTEVDKPRYLLIFVTATIVNERGEYVIYED